MKIVSRAIGSVLRGLYDKGASAPADAALLASIEKLNRVSEAIIEEARDAREKAVDDLANER